jgi:hypothetical protein
LWYGEGGIEYDALEADWAGLTCFLNPPYSACGAFVAKAREEANKGATVVMLLPVRTDTKYWHDFIWAKNVLRAPTGQGDWRHGVECRFIERRLTFTLDVPDDLRAWIKSQYAEVLRVYPVEGKDRDAGIAEYCRAMVASTGLPKMAIERILDDYPSDDLLEGAPFPSCVVIFTKAN